MSYDIQFGVKVAGAGNVYAVIGAPKYDNPTYNIRDIFVHSMGWDYEQSRWYRMDIVIPKIERGIKELTFNSSKYQKYAPSNGWGGISTALKCLQSIYNYFFAVDWFDGKRWNDDIPLKCIYMRF